VGAVVAVGSWVRGSGGLPRRFRCSTRRRRVCAPGRLGTGKGLLSPGLWSGWRLARSGSVPGGLGCPLWYLSSGVTVRQAPLFSTENVRRDGRPADRFCRWWRLGFFHGRTPDRRDRARYWENGGETSVENGALLCDRHHVTVHRRLRRAEREREERALSLPSRLKPVDERSEEHHKGWECRLGADGHPELIPPPWIDSEQKPRRNRYWRLKRELLHPPDPDQRE